MANKVLTQFFEDVQDFVKEFAPVVLGSAALLGLAFLFITLCILPMVYLDGHGKAAYLEKTQGIHLSWWEASSLDVNVTDNVTDVTLKKDKETE